MKKIIFTLIVLCYFTTLNAQTKIAVLDFIPGSGLNETEVTGMSDMLIDALFKSNQFTIVERTQLYKILREQGFQTSDLSIGEISKVGNILGVNNILTGTVNYVLGEYNIDVRVIDVKNGEVIATSGITKTNNQTVREVMNTLVSNIITLFDTNANKKLNIGQIVTVDGIQGVIYQIDYDGTAYVISYPFPAEDFRTAKYTADRIYKETHSWRMPNMGELLVFAQSYLMNYKSFIDADPFGMGDFTTDNMSLGCELLWSSDWADYSSVRILDLYFIKEAILKGSKPESALVNHPYTAEGRCEYCLITTIQ